MMIIATSIAELVQAIVAVAAVVYALAQWIQIKRNHQAAMRPYVTVQYNIVEHRDGPRVYLIFSNFGRLPARNIQLEFPQGTLFKGVGDTKFPFQNSTGISVLAPAQQLGFMVGRYDPKLKFVQHLETNTIHGTLTYREPQTLKQSMTTEAIQLTLQDFHGAGWI